MLFNMYFFQFEPAVAEPAVLYGNVKARRDILLPEGPRSDGSDTVSGTICSGSPDSLSINAVSRSSEEQDTTSASSNMSLKTFILS